MQCVLKIYILMVTFIFGLLGSLNNVYAGQVVFSGQVLAKQGSSVPMMGTVTSFGDVAAIQLNVLSEELREGLAVVRVNDARGHLVSSKVIMGQGTASQSFIMFKLNEMKQQDVTLCVERNAVGKSDVCVRYRVQRAG